MIPPGEIVDAVCEYFGVTPRNLRGPARTRSCSEPRKVAAYLIRERTVLSYQEIAALFGRTDHTTAIYWVRYCDKEIERGSLYMISTIKRIKADLSKRGKATVGA
jgi:chromosomal replication initiation ATPase DnaA